MSLLPLSQKVTPSNLPHSVTSLIPNISFLKAAALIATGMIVLYKLSLKAGLKIEIII